jgi:hypothetical protein
MKANVTLKLDTDLIREARILAAEEGTSISAMLAEQVEALVREHHGFERARKRALTRLRHAPALGWRRPESRGDLHER